MVLLLIAIIVFLIWFIANEEKRKQHPPDFNEWMEKNWPTDEEIDEVAFSVRLDAYIEKYYDPLRNNLWENSFTSKLRTRLRILEEYKPEEKFQMFDRYEDYVRAIRERVEESDREYRKRISG